MESGFYFYGSEFTQFGNIFAVLFKILIMKRIWLLFMVISFAAITNAQNTEVEKMKVIGDFIYFNQECKTAASNESEDLSIVNEVILRKALITSIAAQYNPPRRKTDDRYESKVIVTTSEKIAYEEYGVESKAMSSAYKTYEFMFEDSSSAKSFISELMELCAED